MHFWPYFNGRSGMWFVAQKINKNLTVGSSLTLCRPSLIPSVGVIQIGRITPLCYQSLTTRGVGPWGG